MTQLRIGDRLIGPGHPCYVVAEVSCNHEGDFDEARRIIEAAAQAGADAAKIQTYTADTLTRNFKRRAEGTLWANIDLYELYRRAETPWSWHADLAQVAADNGIHLFSSPFDETAVDHLVRVGSPVLKVASFEVVDTKLLQTMAATGLPIIMSTGMTTYLELDEAVRTLRAGGAKELALLHCNSGYPAAFAEANLRTIPVLGRLFDVPVGLSDHTIFADDRALTDPMPHVTPMEAVRLGACIVEVHLTLDRARGRELHAQNAGGFDWAFSREPAELARMIEAIRTVEADPGAGYSTDAEREVAGRTLGTVLFDPTPKEERSRALRPSLWVVEDVKKGTPLRFAGGRPGNIDSIRPGGGLHIRFADLIDGRLASRDLPAGTPLSWDMVES